MNISETKRYLASLIDPELAIPGFRVALVVGSILFVINHIGALLDNEMSSARWLSAALSYVVPYMVSIHGRFSAKRKTGN